MGVCESEKSPNKGLPLPHYLANITKEPDLKLQALARSPWVLQHDVRERQLSLHLHTQPKGYPTVLERNFTLHGSSSTGVHISTGMACPSPRLRQLSPVPPLGWSRTSFEVGANLPHQLESPSNTSAAKLYRSQAQDEPVSALLYSKGTRHMFSAAGCSRVCSPAPGHHRAGPLAVALCTPISFATHETSVCRVMKILRTCSTASSDTTRGMSTP